MERGLGVILLQFASVQHVFWTSLARAQKNGKDWLRIRCFRSARSRKLADSHRECGAPLAECLTKSLSPFSCRGWLYEKQCCAYAIYENPSEIALKKVRKIALSDGRFCLYDII